MELTPDAAEAIVTRALQLGPQGRSGMGAPSSASATHVDLQTFSTVLQEAGKLRWGQVSVAPQPPSPPPQCALSHASPARPPCKRACVRARGVRPSVDLTPLPCPCAAVCRYGRCVSTARWRCQQMGAVAQQDLHLAHVGTSWAVVHKHLLPTLTSWGVDVHEVGGGHGGDLRVCGSGVVKHPPYLRTAPHPLPWSILFPIPATQMLCQAGVGWFAESLAVARSAPTLQAVVVLRGGVLRLNEAQPHGPSAPTPAVPLLDLSSVGVSAMFSLDSLDDEPVRAAVGALV